MIDHDTLGIWGIYHKAAGWFVQLWLIKPGSDEPVSGGIVGASSLAAARLAIPRHMYRLDPTPDDPADLVEVWL